MRKSDLKKQHTKQAIRARISSTKQHSYLGDSILGAIDGTVTTFAIISGVAGAGLRSEIAIILGLANLFADGFSMAASNFLRAKSDEQLRQKMIETEHQHVEQIPEGEKEEIREIYKQKGFESETLDKIVETITQNKQQWVDTMVTEELGLSLTVPKPIIAALTTFLSFCIVGFFPLLPFLITRYTKSIDAFLISSILTALAFFVIGLIKGIILNRNKLTSGLETFIIGYGAAILAYLIGLLTKGIAS